MMKTSMKPKIIQKKIVVHPQLIELPKPSNNTCSL